jgi:hypothetical protein
MYIDCTAVAAQLRENPPATLPFPQQGLIGNCWFLTVAVGLNILFPHLILDMVQLNETCAVVSFPRRSPIYLSYVLPLEPLTVQLRWAEDLYWALLCAALCQVLYEEGGARFTYKRIRSGLAAHPRALFTDAHGGRGSEALRIMVPGVFGEARLLHQNDMARDAATGTGLLLAEVARDDSWHSLLILRLGDTSCVAYDPWGGVVDIPRRLCTVWFYPMTPTRALTC